jgi:hypothetical protein
VLSLTKVLIGYCREWLLSHRGQQSTLPIR